MVIASDEFVVATGVRVMSSPSDRAGDRAYHTVVQLVQAVAPGSVDSFVRKRVRSFITLASRFHAISETLAVIGEGDVRIVRGGSGQRARLLGAQPRYRHIELFETALLTSQFLG